MDLHIVNQTPVVIADDLFTYKEYKAMFDEFKRIKERGLMQTGNETYGDLHDDGSMKKDNSSVFLDYIYQNRAMSDILCYNRKVFSEPVVSHLINLHPLFNYLSFSNSDCTLLSYYDSDNKYEKHIDLAVFSVLTWFYEEPKKFEGGEFVIEDDFVVECRANRTVFMPSYLNHAVTPVKPSKSNRGLGRYTMTQFACIGPIK
jgi:hypothetical protein